MGWWAYIETDRGEILRVSHPDGSTGGKAFFAFLDAWMYCDAPDEMGINFNGWYNWLTELDKKSEGKLCKILNPLLNCYYSGDWNYQADEYEIFKLRFGTLIASEEEFRRNLRSIEDKWTSLAIVLASTERLIQLFKAANMSDEAEGLYDPVHTLLDFQNLYDTLLIFQNRNVEKVRIRIE